MRCKILVVILRLLTHVPLKEPIHMTHVLYVLDFKFSLILVNKLLTNRHLFALFTPEKCTFQDPSTKLTVAVAPMDNGLY